MRSTTTVAWIRSRLEQAGVRADAGVVERLLELVGDNPYALQAEIDKLADWAAGEAVGVTEVERLVTPSDEMPGLGALGRLGGP